MKFSIITPTLNSEKTILDCLQSVSGQSYSYKEHIIVDGGSVDKTIEIARRFSQGIRILSKKDNGLYDAINRGIKMASGDIIGILHSDDFYASNSVLQKVYEVFKNSSADSCYGDLNYVLKNSTDKIIRRWKAGSFDMGKFKNGWMPPHPTFFVKKGIYLKYGLFDLAYKISSDYELMLRFLYKNKISTAYLPEILVNMRIGGESNKNIKKIFIKMKEDYLIAKKYGFFAFKTVFLKNFLKLSQFF